MLGRAGDGRARRRAARGAHGRRGDDVDRRARRRRSARRSCPGRRRGPLSTIAATSHVFSTSSSRCEESSTVRPSSTSARTSPRNSRMPAGSSPLTGSSRISSSGSHSRQRATPSRWRMPSEYVPTLSSARRPRPTRSSAASTRPWARLSRAAACTWRFSRPVRCGWKRGSSMIAPTRASASARSPGRSWPSSRIVPAGRLGEAEQQADQRRLAGAVGPEEAERAAARHLQVDGLERGAVTEALPEAVVSMASEVMARTYVRSVRSTSAARLIYAVGPIRSDETACRAAPRSARRGTPAPPSR